VAGINPTLPPLVDPEQGLGLSDMEWPPSHWFAPQDAPLAAEIDVGAAQPPAPPDVTPGQTPGFGMDGPPPPAPQFPWQAPPPNQGQDAVTGATGFAVAPPTTQTPDDAPLFPWETPAALQPPSPEQQQAEADQQADQLLAAGPMAQAREKARLESQRDSFESKAYLDADTQNRQTEEKNRLEWRARETKLAAERADLRRRVMELGQKEPDPKRWYKDQGTGGLIASGILAGLSGLLAPYNQGRNTFLEFVDGQIEKDLEAQKAGIANQRASLDMQQGLLADEYARSGDIYKSEETARLAYWQNVVQRIAAQSAGLDPRGTQALNAASMMQGAKEKLEAAAMQADERAFQRAKDEHAMRIASGQLAEQRRSRLSSDAESRARYESEHGVLFNPKTGRYEPDPNAPAPPMKLSDVKTQLEIENMVKGSTVQDSRGQLIGRAVRGVDGAKLAAEEVQAYEDFRSGLAALHDKIAKTKTAYKGLLSDKWPAEEVAAINAIREPLVFNLARVMNGPGPLSSADVDAARSSIPNVDGWTESKKPGSVYAAMAEKVDRSFDKRLGVQIEDWNPERSPTRRYQAMDRASKEVPDAAKREDVVRKASAEISPLTKGDEDLRQSEIAGRRQAIDAMGDRQGGMTAQEFDGLRVKLEAELKEGLLSEKEFSLLMGAASANRLIRGDAPDPGEALVKAGRGAELERRKRERGY
jgi:hypothetical protein